MAATTSVTVEERAPATAVRAPQPRPAPKKRGGRIWLMVVGVLATVAVIATFFWMVRTRRQAGTATAEAPAFAPVTRSRVARTVRVGGTVAAVNFAGVSAPAMRGQGGNQLTVVAIAKAGDRAKPGDLLAEFDRQQQLNTFEEKRAEFVSLSDQILKRRAELDVQREQIRTELIKARTDLDSARLENKRNEIISKIDAEKNQQTLAEAQATLKMLEQTEKLKLDAAEAELKTLEIRRDRERLQMENAKLNYERLEVRASIPGMIVLTPIWKGNQMGTVQEGDQVRSGIVFLQVVNSNEMQVRARVNQLDAALLRPGMRGVMRLDAYPDIALTAKVESISTLASAPGWWSRFIKTFPITFTVEGTDQRLIPDISSSVDVEIEAEDNAVSVPRSAVVRQAGARNAGFVWVKDGAGLKARAVTLGVRSDTHWAIKSGVKEGEMVALSPPASAAGANPPTNAVARAVPHNNGGVKPAAATP